MLLTTFIKRLESYKLYRQERIKRWQMSEYTYESNDATHQLYATQITLILSELFKIPDSIALRTIKYVCCHDYVECTPDSLGDVNWKLKEENPDIKEIVERQERIAMQRVPEFYNTMIEFEADVVANKLFVLADALEALLYVRREIRRNKQTDEWEQKEIELMPRIEENWNYLNKYAANHSDDA